MSESYIAEQLECASVEPKPHSNENNVVMQEHEDEINDEEFDHVSDTDGEEDEEEDDAKENVGEYALVVVPKALHSPSTPNNHTTKEGTTSNDVAGTSKGGEPSIRKRRRETMQSGNTNSAGKFAKKFTAADEEEILKSLAKSGFKSGTKDFWDKVSGSIQLSIQASASQVYEKIRRLREKYIRACSDPGNKLRMRNQEPKLYELSEKIWLEDAKSFHEAEKVDDHVQGRKEEEYEKKPKVVMDDYDIKLDKLVSQLTDNDQYAKFPLSEALDLLSGTKKKKITKMRKDMNPLILKVYLKRIELIQETLKAVVSSPSFPPTD